MKKKANIVILATGGTIAGQSASSLESSYTSGKLEVNELLRDIPSLDKIANIKAFQVANIGSQDMDFKILIHLAKTADEFLKKNEVDGVVILHGSDTLEESAYFLNLTIKSKKPIIFTGSMRSSSSISSDGAMNIVDAITVASKKKSRKKGVLIVFNNEIHLSREISKTKTTSLNAFESLNIGKIGYVYYGKVNFYAKSTKLHTYKSKFDIDKINNLPLVEIVYSYLNSNKLLIEFLLKTNVKGIVVAGLGNGNIFHESLDELKKASKNGIIVVRSSRVGQGIVSKKGEIGDKIFLSADNLNPQKARILLLLALNKTQNRKKIQKLLFTH